MSNSALKGLIPAIPHWSLKVFPRASGHQLVLHPFLGEDDDVELEVLQWDLVQPSLQAWAGHVGDDKVIDDGGIGIMVDGVYQGDHST